MSVPPDQIQWDDAPAPSAAAAVDPSQIKWDDAGAAGSAGGATAAAGRSWPQALEQEGQAALHGAEREGMGLGNITGKALPQQLAQYLPSNQDLQNFDQAHAGEFGNNKLGKFAGQALPLALAQLIPGLDVGADAGLGAQGLSIAGNAALGGLGSAATADPEHQLSSGLEGAALGGGLSAAGNFAKVPLSATAQRLQGLLQRNGQDGFVPVAAGGKGALATTLRYLMPNAPGTSDIYNSQMRDLAGDLRGAAARNASPVGALKPGTPWQQLPQLKQQFDSAYNDIMSRWEPPTDELQAPENIGGHVLDRIMQAAPDTDADNALSVAQQVQDIVKAHNPGANGYQLTGPGLQNAWNAVGKKVAGAQLEDKAIWNAARSGLDDLRQWGLSPEDQQAFQVLNSRYSEFAPFKGAVNASKAKNGQFTPTQLGQRAQRGTDALQAAQDMNALTATGAPLRTPVGRYLTGTVGAALSPVLLPLSTRLAQRGLYNGAAGSALTRALPLAIGAQDASGQ